MIIYRPAASTLIAVIFPALLLSSCDSERGVDADSSSPGRISRLFGSLFESEPKAPEKRTGVAGSESLDAFRTEEESSRIGEKGRSAQKPYTSGRFADPALASAGGGAEPSGYNGQSELSGGSKPSGPASGDNELELLRAQLAEATEMIEELKRLREESPAPVGDREGSASSSDRNGTEFRENQAPSPTVDSSVEVAEGPAPPGARARATSWNPRNVEEINGQNAPIIYELKADVATPMDRIARNISSDYRSLRDEFSKDSFLTQLAPAIESRIKDARSKDGFSVTVSSNLKEYDFNREAFPTGMDSRTFISISGTTDNYAVMFTNGDSLGYVHAPVEEARRQAAALASSHKCIITYSGTLEKSGEQRLQFQTQKVIHLRVRRITMRLERSGAEFVQDFF